MIRIIVTLLICATAFLGLSSIHRAEAESGKTPLPPCIQETGDCPVANQQCCKPLVCKGEKGVPGDPVTKCRKP